MKQTLIEKYREKIARYEDAIEFHKAEKTADGIHPDVITDCNAEIRRLNFLKHQAQEFIADLESI